MVPPTAVWTIRGVGVTVLVGLLVSLVLPWVALRGSDDADSRQLGLFYYRHRTTMLWPWDAPLRVTGQTTATTAAATMGTGVLVVGLFALVLAMTIVFPQRPRGAWSWLLPAATTATAVAALVAFIFFQATIAGYADGHAADPEYHLAETYGHVVCAASLLLLAVFLGLVWYYTPVPPRGTSQQYVPVPSGPPSTSKSSVATPAPRNVFKASSSTSV
jgi:hypothetical protein